MSNSREPTLLTIPWCHRNENLQYLVTSFLGGCLLMEMTKFKFHFCFLAHGLGVDFEVGAGVDHKVQGRALALPVPAVTESGEVM